jgi:hypothetical protein
MMEMQMISPMTRSIMAAGRRERFFYEPIAYAPPITAPVFVKRGDINWWYVDRRESPTEIPYFADRAKYPIIKAGFTIVQEYVGDEAPKLLTVVKDPPPPIDYREGFEDIFTAAGRALRGVGAALAFVLATGVILIDPALVCVVEVENGKFVHVEVAWWYH